MGDKTGISWTDATWNPVVGCSVVSPGCTNCYAMKMADRIEGMVIAYARDRGGDPGPMFHYEGTTTRGETGSKPAVWTGKVALAPERVLTAPLRWRRPRRIFVNSMGDLFHESVPDAWIDQVFAVMALAPHHTFQVLTKRSARMRAYCQFMCNRDDLIAASAEAVVPGSAATVARFARMSMIPNVWLGVSAEDQRRLDERVPDLLDTPAAIRFVSAEPLLGPLNLRARPSTDLCIRCGLGPDAPHDHPDGYRTRGLDWVIAGGESGPNARPMHPAWARSIRDQCAASGVAFHFKQWGEWADADDWPSEIQEDHDLRGLTSEMSIRVGRVRAGRLLDGIEHNGIPAVRA